MKQLISTVSVCIVASCSVVGPDYTPPQIDLEQHYAFAQSSNLESAAFDRWWETFRDPVLNNYLSRGLSESTDIRIALERIEEAQAAVRAAGATQLDGSLGASALQTSVNGDSFDGYEQGTLNANYVFDLFGGYARARQQADAELDAAVYDVWTTRLAYQSELVGAYIEARYFQTALSIARRTVSNRQRTLNLVEERVNANAATVLESARAEAELSLTKADIPRFEIGFERNAVRIAALLNTSSRSILDELQRSYRGIPTPSTSLSPGVPTNLLRNRPDILSAERTLAAQMAAVGVSEAALYPSLSLGGSIRVDSDNTLIIGPSINIPVFDRPLLQARRDAAISRARQAELTWQGTVNDAVAEVEQTLSRADNRRQEIASLSKASSDYAKLTSLSQEAFEAGASTLLELQDAEQNVTRTQNTLALSRRAYATAIAELAIATGRGARVGEQPSENVTRDAPGVSDPVVVAEN